MSKDQEIEFLKNKLEEIERRRKEELEGLKCWKKIGWKRRIGLSYDLEMRLSKNPLQNSFSYLMNRECQIFCVNGISSCS